jgi:hypothetical protein
MRRQLDVDVELIKDTMRWNGRAASEDIGCIFTILRYKKINKAAARQGWRVTLTRMDALVIRGMPAECPALSREFGREVNHRLDFDEGMFGGGGRPHRTIAPSIQAGNG